MKSFIHHFAIVICLFALFLSTEVYAYDTLSDTISAPQKQIVIPSDDELQKNLIYDTATNIVYFKSNEGVYYPYYSPHGNLYRYENGELKEVSNTDTHYVILLFCIIFLLCILPKNVYAILERSKHEDYL